MATGQLNYKLNDQNSKVGPVGHHQVLLSKFTMHTILNMCNQQLDHT